MYLAGTALALAFAAFISLIRLVIDFRRMSEKLACVENRLSQLEAQANHPPSSP
jgi:hypothetical protein